MRGVVDENVDWAEAPADRCDGGAQRFDISQLGLLEVNLAARPAMFRNQGFGRRLGDVDKGGFRALLGEAPGDRRADAAAPAGNEDDFAF